MLSSIHPLGERARNNRWSVTVSAFVLGTTGAGAVGGLVLGWLGALIGFEAVESGPAILGALAVVAGFLDLFGVRAPTNHRQVNERWIGTYRGWVYGAGFGAQLGLGFATYVVTWLTYAVPLAALLSGSPTAGAIIGAAFGFARSWTVLSAGVIDRPSRLTSSSLRLAAIAGAVHRTAAVSGILIGLMGVLTWHG